MRITVHYHLCDVLDACKFHTFFHNLAGQITDPKDLVSVEVLSPDGSLIGVDVHTVDDTDKMETQT